MIQRFKVGETLVPKETKKEATAAKKNAAHDKQGKALVCWRSGDGEWHLEELLWDCPPTSVREIRSGSRTVLSEIARLWFKEQSGSGGVGDLPL